MWSISKFIEAKKAKKMNDKQKELVNEANSTYQLMEYNGEIWLTFNGVRSLPSSLLKCEPLEAIKTLRKLYIENKNG